MVDGDLRKAESLAAALDGVKQVIHLGALVRSTDPKENDAVNAVGTRNLLAKAGASGVERVVGLSSDSVLRTRRSPYARSKAEGEEALLAWTLLQTGGDTARAVTLAELAVGTQPRPDFLDTHARVLAAMGRCSDALDSAQRAAAEQAEYRETVEEIERTCSNETGPTDGER